MIGVFDSGMGGLTSVRELIKLIPDNRIIYFGDTGRVPYGGRSVETIVHYALQDGRFLASKNVDMILVACGTVSSTSLPALRTELGIPIVGVVEPACDAAIAATKNKKIGIIGTAATINSGSMVNYIANVAPEVETMAEPCPLFVPLVEGGFATEGNEISRLAAKHYLAPFVEAGVDTLILGCTHYPLLMDAISTALPGVTLINSGAEAAKKVANMLEGTHDADPGVEYYVTDSVDQFRSLATIFLGKDKIEDKIEKIDIEKY